MAKDNFQDTSKTNTNTFIKGLNKDSDPSFVAEGMWTHARNAVNNTLEGDLGTLSNESSTIQCAIAGATLGPAGSKRYVIGTIYLYSDKWVIFTVAYAPTGLGAAIGSEIGLYEEDTCNYRPIVQDTCLNFSKYFLISGASRETQDCSWAVFFADGKNPDRHLNIGDPQTWPTSSYIWIGNNTYSMGTNTMQWPGVDWVQTCTTGATCIICTDTTELDCNAIRLARLMTTPCIKVSNAVGAGTLLNGSYSATIAYTINGQKVTDYFSASNIQPIFHPDNSLGSLSIQIDADTVNFDEFVLVIIQTVNQGTIAKEIGYYSTRTTNIELDQIKLDLINIPIKQIPIQTPIFEKSDQMIEINNYLLRVGPTAKFDFNYQPLANLIQAEWVSVEYPANYYVDGGSNTSYLRDEVYAFFIRWVYNTGDKSSSYHIPGRAPTTYNGNFETDPYFDINTLQGDTDLFQTVNTAIQTSSVQSTLPDGGLVVARGKMGYWQSTEIYPDNRPDIWNSSSQCWTATTDPKFDLCGKPIRHHKFPDNRINNHFSNGGQNIRLMGVDFKNIIYPKDNDGNDIKGIVGYEILRGSREGNKTIIAKGMINNLRDYNIKNGTNSSAGQPTGLYPNYPFNTIVPTSNSIGGNVAGFNDPYIKLTDENGNIVGQNVPINMTTFHSPDTNFRTPFLSNSELKLYGNLKGISTQQFIVPAQHPQFKLLGNLVILPMIVAGVVEAIVSFGGTYTINKAPLTGGGYTSASYLTMGANQLAAGIIYAPLVTAYNTLMTNYFNNGGSTLDALSNAAGLGTPIITGINTTFAAETATAAAAGVVTAYNTTYDKTYSKWDYLGPVGAIIGGLQQTMYYFSEGAELALRLMYALAPYDDYGLQSIAHGLYDTYFAPLNTSRVRFNLADSFYLKDTLQQVSQFPNPGNKRYLVNNLKRSNTVVLRTTNNLGVNDGPRFINGPSDIANGSVDTSLVTLGTANLAGMGVNTDDNPFDSFNTTIASHYAGVKVRIDNQYGQLSSIKQVIVTPCEQKISDSGIQTITTSTFCPGINQLLQQVISSTPVFFGGDTYINRYTEKNTMFFFYDWLYGQPDGFEYNYYLRNMIGAPRFWANSQKYDLNNLAELFNLDNITDIINVITGISNNITGGVGPFPTNFYNLDQRNYNYTNDAHGDYPGLFRVKKSYFYLNNSSVRDFFVESDVIVDFRETGIPIYEKVYNPNTYTDLLTMFTNNPETITRGNYYAYDYSLSVSKIFTQYFSQASLQSRYYDPNVSKLCFTYYPDRIIYSLPQQQQSFKDSWYVYLANNYKEFKNQISGVKNFAKTGIFITFKNASPLVIQGIDQLQTESGTKITIGDGGLFAQTPQSVIIADDAYEYGSSQNRRSVISTPAGMFYMSQNQGKIFQYTQGITEISSEGLKWWYTLFMPYKLTEDFPDYPHQDNPVAGIGCQSVFDNQNSVLYFCKKDYKLKPQYKDLVTYNTNTDAFMLGQTPFALGNPILFEDASWTTSYDPKTKFWISFHDWHPDLVMPSKYTFMTTKENGIWRHNDSCNHYCNYYGADYPFEVELPMVTGQTVTTVKSMEYLLECYKRSEFNCVDQFQVLDFNFDRAVVFNAEQVSGYLNLNIFPKNNITLSLDYPKYNPGNPSYDILFSKEENKYRFNQFWDITKDRGEFPIGSVYPNTTPVIAGTTILPGAHTQENLWVTQSNGYIKTLNPVNLDYAKDPLQRKKMRHYLNLLHLRKDVSGDINMILKISNSKNQISLR
jgi:hypothetical protein